MVSPIIDKHLALAFSAVTFLPIHSFSDRAEDLIAERAEILAKNADKYRPGLREQYDRQLEMMKSKHVPDCELVFLPFNSVSKGDYRSASTCNTVLTTVIASDPDLSSVCLVSVLAHPWSRGTIVRLINEHRMEQRLIVFCSTPVRRIRRSHRPSTLVTLRKRPTSRSSWTCSSSSARSLKRSL